MELVERMQKTVEGQVTWASPELGKKCIDCIHASVLSRPSGHRRHVCKLVRIVSGKAGVPFDAQRAIACSKFSDVVDAPIA